MANLSKVIYINEEDYSTLLNGGTIIKSGVTYSHDPTALYVIKNVSAPEYAETAGYATTAGQATKATQDGNGDVISETYVKKADAVEAIHLTGTLSGGYWTFEDINGNTLTDAEMIALLEDPNKLISIYYDGFSDGTRTYDATVFRPIGSDSTTFTNFDGWWERYFYISLDWENGRVFDNEHLMGDSLESKQKEIITLGGTNNAPTFTNWNDTSLTHIVFKTQYLDSSKKDVILKVQTSTDVYHYYQLFKSEKQSTTLTNYRFISFPNTSAVECIELLYNSSNNTFQRGGSNISLQILINSGNKLSADYIQDGTNNKVFSAADKTKLDGIATGAEVNVQANWTETDTNSDAYIQNKPTIPTVNNGTLTIQQNGITAGTFTANQSSNTTVNIYSTMFGIKGQSGFERDTYNSSNGTWSGVEIVTPDPLVTYIDISNNKLYRYNPLTANYVELSGGGSSITSTAITDLTDIL